ncbi:DNA-binding response regulator [Rhodococcus sp. RS1C4]|uniref:response regulator n=1 Tax=Nocardiaceae TaxID=85025 RepID=UPI00037DCD55|nr:MULTISPECIES: response regulator transcription factor [Rhodococcus]OZC54877.1 DNA-binding response regulator [Rhodococcus sp. RS1C4]OZC74369.1 DNA-binding response regulator [Rhodococcus sp. 06-418-1B]OZD10057.1 DNA-binding response regulator [Rhodococcus sp. 06-156-4C]OZD21964.1 DNA-binding response regulator [Rhodococcus sp. 06-156-3C]OZD24220.1 DNA-binding response regulator [Rhodococcus sp. 06-156-4a]
MRIVIAEDNVILRDGLAQLLIERGNEVCAAVGNAEALEAAVDEHRPDVAIIDIRMPPSFTDEGLVAAVALRRRRPETGVMVFSQWVETRYAAELLADRASGVGYLLKDRVADVGEFVEALARVAAGGTALDPEVITQLMGASKRRTSLDRLTPREREVLALMAQGLTNSAVASKLTVSERVVEKHVGNVFAKFDLPPSDAQHRRVLAVLEYLDGVRT